jgi:hypothetical protein
MRLITSNYSERLNATAKLVAVDRVAVADQVVFGITFCEGFNDLRTPAIRQSDVR